MAAILDSDRIDQANFALQVTLMLPTKFQVDLSFGSGEEAKIRFSRWQPNRSFWISDRNDFNCFLIYKLPRCFLPSFKTISYFCSKHKLWVLVGTASTRRFQRVPTIYILSRNKKNNIYPCKPQYYYIKAGFEGIKII